MTALLIIVWIVIGFLAGAIGLTALAGVPSMEGQAGYFALFIGGPLGALCGAAVGFVIAQRFAEDQRKKRIALIVSAVALVVPIAGAVAFEMARTWDRLDSSGQPASLAYRIRLPAEAPTPAGKSAGFELRSDKENVACKTYDSPLGLAREADRWILSGECKIRFVTPRREIWARLGGGPNLIFKLRLAARYEVVPYSVSSWYRVDEVLDTATGSQRRPPKPEEAGYEVLLSAR